MKNLIAQKVSFLLSNGKILPSVTPCIIRNYVNFILCYYFLNTWHGYCLIIDVVRERETGGRKDPGESRLVGQLPIRSIPTGHK
jgi:hypothetical protein